MSEQGATIDARDDITDVPGVRAGHWTDPDGLTTTHAYDAAGNRIRTTRTAPGAVTRELNLRHDALGRVSAELSAEGGALLALAATPEAKEAVWASYAIHHTYDTAGSKTATLTVDKGRGYVTAAENIEDVE